MELEHSNQDHDTAQHPYPSQPSVIGHTEFQQHGDGGYIGGSSMENLRNGPGAGPLPARFGLPPAIGGGNILTEWTKRRHWQRTTVEELKDLLHILTPDGRIVYLSSSCQGLTGYPTEELTGKFIIDYIHQDDSSIFMREFNESITTGNPLRFFYRFRKKDGLYTIFESHGHPHLTAEASTFGPSNTAGFCRGFFMMARPYPTKNAALLDSFLEHKIENERLRKRIQELKREEAEEAEDAQRQWEKKHGNRFDMGSETDATSTITQQKTNLDILKMPPPAKPLYTNTSLTRENLEDVNASRGPDSMKDKMARYEGATHIETIEMLTGLRYQEGERSQGISTGDKSPALMRGDVGIAMPLDKDRAGSEKKKNKKKEEEYVCTDCGTLESPEWRKGPTGPKTLCNACGLRWAKKEKKRAGPAAAPIGMTSGSDLPE
ncbi:hypothetical protein B0O99DRAFT_509783 [Bisporella sp. PMI_857]|nr:hypothetical protein B0O99DRAFT_509783 [Bisporella sp. PMI_857]